MVGSRQFLTNLTVVDHIVHTVCYFEQHEVLQQCLSVGELQRIAKAAAVLDGVGDVEP